MRKGVWIAAFAGIAASILFVATAALVGSLPEADQAQRLVVALLMAGFPAAVWISAFYRMDALEQEPKERMLELFILGALLSGGATIPLLDGILGAQAKAASGSWTFLAASILVTGFVAEYGKYALVRFTVFRGDKFNERTDGIVYGAAVGLGYAFAYNVSYLMSSSASDLTAAAMTIAVETLGHASFSGIAGWFLASMKFKDEPVWWMPLGISLAATANGIFHLLVNSISRQGLDYSPWNGFALSGAFALAVFGSLFYLARRATRQALARTDGSEAANAREGGGA
jgi:RsiW-degrading membrane proteinase PrsW (M82 family)